MKELLIKLSIIPLALITIWVVCDLSVSVIKKTSQLRDEILGPEIKSTPTVNEKAHCRHVMYPNLYGEDGEES